MSSMPVLVFHTSCISFLIHKVAAHKRIVFENLMLLVYAKQCKEILKRKSGTCGKLVSAPNMQKHILEKQIEAPVSKETTYLVLDNADYILQCQISTVFNGTDAGVTFGLVPCIPEFHPLSNMQYLLKAKVKYPNLVCEFFPAKLVSLTTVEVLMHRKSNEETVARVCICVMYQNIPVPVTPYLQISFANPFQ